MTVAAGLAHYTENEARGEFVLVLEGLVEAAARGLEAQTADDFDAAAYVRESLAKGSKSKTLAADLSQRNGMSNKEAYAFVQEVKREGL